jgi:hypothetical protein
MRKLQGHAGFRKALAGWLFVSSRNWDTTVFFHTGWTYRVDTVNISVFAEHLVTTLTAKNRSNTPRDDFRSDSASREGRFGVALATGTKIA